jgi:hypothetical protein
MMSCSMPCFGGPITVIFRAESSSVPNLLFYPRDGNSRHAGNHQPEYKTLSFTFSAVVHSNLTPVAFISRVNLHSFVIQLISWMSRDSAVCPHDTLGPSYHITRCCNINPQNWGNRFSQNVGRERLRLHCITSQKRGNSKGLHRGLVIGRHNGSFTAGMSRVRFPMRTLDFSIYLILPATPWPWSRLCL